MVRGRLILPSLAALVLVGSVTTGLVRAWWWTDDDGEAAESGELVEIDWSHLVPEGFEPVDPFAGMTQEEIDELFDGSAASNARLSELEEASAYAPVVEGLDGQRVKLPGYLVPLDYDSVESASEFLVVPYVGACVHVPPPPPNQVVHANAAEPVALGEAWEPVWVSGTINVETVLSELAESGYRMDVIAVEPYTEE